MEQEQALRAKTRWNAMDTLEVAQARPAFRTWHFAPGSEFDDAALAGLAQASALSVLAFRESTLTPENLRALAAAPKLVRLDLNGCRFTDAALAALCEALSVNTTSKLTELWLENTPLGDDALRLVGIVPKLRWLILSGTAITDSGLPHLHSLRHLETLWLERTRVTDAGVLHLAPLPRLTAVPTRETACSPDLPEQLFRAQMALQAPSKAPDPAQQEAADARLRTFLQAMETWERNAYARAQQIEQQFRTQRPQSHVFSEAEGEANRLFWNQINQQKEAIATEFCTHALRAHGAGHADSYGSPPHLTAQSTPWLSVATPSRTKTVFLATTSPDSVYRGRRYTLKQEANQWRVDAVHYWSGGWKTDRI